MDDPGTLKDILGTERMFSDNLEGWELSDINSVIESQTEDGQMETVPLVLLETVSEFGQTGDTVPAQPSAAVNGAGTRPTNGTAPAQKPKRTRKVLKKNEDILDALDDSVQMDDSDEDFSGSGEDYGSDLSDEEDGASKKLKLEEEEDRRRSGRERKVPKKFENTPESRKKKKKMKSGGGSPVAEDSEDEAEEAEEGNRRKRKREDKKKSAKPKPPPKSAKAAADDQVAKKLVRKKKRQSDVKAKGDKDSDVSEEDVVSKSFKKRLKQKTKDSEANKSGRIQERSRVKYAEEEEEHSSDLRSDLEEADYLPPPVEEDVDTIDFVLDHRIGEFNTNIQVFLLKNFEIVCLSSDMVFNPDQIKNPRNRRFTRI